MGAFGESMIVRNAYKLIPLVVLGYGLARGAGRSKSLFNFNYAVSVQSELNNIAKRIEQDSAAGFNTPTPETFADYVHQNFSKKAGISRDQMVDLWGNTYVLVIENGVARVISPGPDKKLGTGDDLVAEARLTPVTAAQ